MRDPSAVVAELRAQWAKLEDLDRADAVFLLYQSGISLRRLARELNCSDSLLRRLLRARNASAEDRALVKEGSISTRELARRATGARFMPASRCREAVELERAMMARDNCGEICNWLAAEGINGARRKEIVREARQLLDSAEKNGTLPRYLPPTGTTAREIIAQSRPPLPIPRGAEAVRWYGSWLAQWLGYHVSDSQFRRSALKLAEQDTGAQ